ncbi:M67 family metallopeptidase [Dethiobacter alkaliphilus]|uniref:M67 family metallopeptidase n=1 Tax=Dethiobacter alkaliphilus TaxID=427926 RepID=UPI0022267C96|nr:M67 family metallopeptidase [Dethiobacter alkaliphilus]MCW3491259.1 M67 family metallopeptidase [Dethiobacter alkaliphilus]
MSGVYKLDAHLYRQMLKQCEKEAPAEACGLLGGADGLSGTRIFPLENLDACAESYKMDPKAVLSVMKTLDENDMELNAIYHSHPATPSRPSKVDIAQAYMQVVYLILSLAGDEPVLKGFYIDEGDVTEVPVEIVEKAGEADVK